MNLGPLVFLGTFFALATSWLGFVLAPQLQIGGDTEAITISGDVYPPMRPGLARQGEQIYRAEGCFYCHSQQVRPKGYGSDVERGWGGRPGKVQSVDRDYLYGRPVMLGDQRVGPDLTNIGLRQTNEVLLLQHLYNPQFFMPHSVMPPYRFLFEKRKLKFGEKPSADALPDAVTHVVAGYEVLPTDDARALAAYLISLRSDGIIPDAPSGIKPKPAAVSTNAIPAANAAPAVNVKSATPATATNSSVK